MCIFLFCHSHFPPSDSLPSACRDTACCVLNEHREYIPNFAIAKSSKFAKSSKSYALCPNFTQYTLPILGGVSNGRGGKHYTLHTIHSSLLILLSIFLLSLSRNEYKGSLHHLLYQQIQTIY